MSEDAAEVGTDTAEDLGGQMSLVDHLEELRNRLIKSVGAIFLGAIVAWILYPQIYDFLVQPLCDILPPDECRLVITDPVQGLSTRMRVAGYGGMALAMPVILWQLWRFVTPGLLPHEKTPRHSVRGSVRCSCSSWAPAWRTGPCPGRSSSSITIGGGPRAAVFTPGQVLPVARLHDAGVRDRLRVPDPADLPADWPAS